MKSAYRRILVHFDNTRRATARLALARRLAQQQGASVAALHAVAPSYVELPLADAAGPGAMAMLRELDQQRVAAARGRFEDALATAGGPRASWAATNEFPLIGAFVQQALYADLMVLGQWDERDPDSAGVPRDFVASVAIGSGKPALVLPYTGTVPNEFNIVALAWKESREAARALTAAMPLLQQARYVVVLTWGADTAMVHGTHLQLTDYLRLYGIEAEWQPQGSDEPREIGELLLSRTADLSADLLVMGCYGHSRAREWVLGGATRTVMASMTLPVLLAH